MKDKKLYSRFIVVLSWGNKRMTRKAKKKFKKGLSNPNARIINIKK